MLSKIIVRTWSILIEISLWLLIFISIVGGWMSGGFFGAVGGLIIAFLFGSMFLGAFLVLEDIRKSVKAIENNK